MVKLRKSPTQSYFWPIFDFENSIVTLIHGVQKFSFSFNSKSLVLSFYQNDKNQDQMLLGFIIIPNFSLSDSNTFIQINYFDQKGKKLQCLDLHTISLYALINILPKFTLPTLIYQDIGIFHVISFPLLSFCKHLSKKQKENKPTQRIY